MTCEGNRIAEEVNCQDEKGHEEKNNEDQCRCSSDTPTESPGKVDDTVPVELRYGYSLLPAIVSDVNKKWWDDVCKSHLFWTCALCGKQDAVSPFLQAALSPREHFSCIFLMKNGVMFFPRMVWQFCSVLMWSELEMKSDGEKIWGDATGQYCQAI